MAKAGFVANDTPPQGSLNEQPSTTAADAPGPITQSEKTGSTLQDEARNLTYGAPEPPKRPTIGPPGPPLEQRPQHHPIHAGEVYAVFEKHGLYQRNIDALRNARNTEPMTPREKQVVDVAIKNYNVINRLSNDEWGRERGISHKDVEALWDGDVRKLGTAARASVFLDPMNFWFDMPGESTLGAPVMLLSTPYAVISAPIKLYAGNNYYAQKSEVEKLMSNEGLQTPTPVLQVVEGPGHLPTTSTTARRAPIERSKHPGCGIVGGIAGYQMMKDGDAIAKIGGYLLGAAVGRAACNGVDAMVEAAKENERMHRERQQKGR